MKWWTATLIGAGGLAVIAGVAYSFVFSGRDVDLENPPQFIEAEFVDLSRIFSISKFRSGAGHDFSGSGETCRSMKHYYTPNINPNIWTQDASGQRLPPKPDGKTDIPIFSPVTGTIVSVSEEQTPIGKQVSILPSKAKQFNIRLFHVFLLDGIVSGSQVKAGQQIGVIGADQETDIAVQLGAGPWSRQYVSYFEVIPDSLFQAYIDRGATSRADFIISRSERDASPLQCDGEQFVRATGYDYSINEFHLSGYVDPFENR